MPNDIPLAGRELNGPPAPRSPGGLLEISEPPWEIYYAVVYGVCVAIVEAGPLSPAGRLLATAALVAMVPWYLCIGRPLMLLDEPAWQRAQASGRGPVYLTGLVALFALAQSQNPNAWFLAFALTSQCFHVTTIRRSMVFVAVLNVTAGVLVVVQHPGLESALTAVGIAVFAITFAYVYGRFTMRVVEQSRERAVLIEELSSTRQELTVVHHEAGVLAERHRLAGEIHDTLAQGFTSIVTLVQAAEAGLGPEAGDARRHLDMALATARDNLAEARALVTVLSPVQLDSSSLGDALRRVTEATGAEAGIQACAEVTGTVRPLPTGTEVVLLRVGQEALANVRRHAGAREVRVCLIYADARVQLTVVDDGDGFDATAANGGYGLRGMRERVAQVGGVLEVRTEPGAGTEVCAEVPG